MNFKSAIVEQTIWAVLCFNFTMDRRLHFIPTLLFTLFWFVSCTDGPGDHLDVDTNTLAFYVSQFPQSDTAILIACAASEQQTNEDFGVSVYFYPEEGSGDFRYYETSSSMANPYDFSQYQYKAENFFPVFNGYLQRYLYPRKKPERWVILTYRTASKLHICDPIRLKHEEKPTLYAPEKIEIDLTEPAEPLFSWETDNDPETIIYFQVVSDSLGNLISGTYTYDKHWQYYDLSNVVLNIKEQNPPPSLDANSQYTFTLMGVSEDNWVNLIGEKKFITSD